MGPGVDLPAELVDRVVIITAPRANFLPGAVLIVVYIASAGSLVSEAGGGLSAITAAIAALPILLAALWILQRPLARLELRNRDLVEWTWLRTRSIAPLDDVVGVRVSSARARWDGLKLFWTRYDFLVLELKSGANIEVRRFWRYEADSLLGSAVTRAATELEALIGGDATDGTSPP